jgi:WD40 repeat protein
MSENRELAIDAAIAEYLQAAEAGARPERETWLAKYPELRIELEQFLADRSAFRAAAEPVEQLTLPLRDAPVDGPVKVRYFGDYELLAEIARGGMGVVFRARQVSLNRPVAVKMILAGQLAGEADVRRFKTEAEAAANLDHPNILPIYEVGEHDGQHYFSMKFVDGGSLADAIRARALEPRQGAELLAKVARAVHFAHQRGILHRDLKPPNILLDAQRSPYVTDFGLARRVEGDSALTQTGAILGTPAYMAPEQARAAKQLSTAADVYSLGAILYELLTGRPPFLAATQLDTILQVLEHEPEDPRKLNPAADRDLAIIALKCLQKEPAKRYGTAEAVAEDLERWLRGEPITARPVPPTERLVKWVRRRPAVAAAGALGIVLVVASVSVGLWYSHRENQRTAAEAVRERQRAETERGLREEADRQLLNSKFEQARADRLAGRPHRALPLLAELAAAGRPPHELRREAMQSLAAPELVLRATLGPRHITIGGEMHQYEFSADGTLLAVVATWAGPPPQFTSSGGIEVWEIASGKMLRRIEAGYSPDPAYAFSPTAPVLALYDQKQKIRIWNPLSDQTAATFDGVPPLVFSADGARLAFCRDANVVIGELATGKVRKLAAVGEPVAFLSPDELVVRHENRLRRWNLTRDQEAFATPVSEPVENWSADGRLAAVKRGHRYAVGAVAVWDMALGRQIAHAPTVAQSYYGRALPLAATTGALAYVAPDDLVAIQILGPAGRRVRLASPRQFGRAMQIGEWRQQGDLLAAGEAPRSVRVWDVNAARPLAYLPDDERPVWSPDGRFMATVGPAQWFRADERSSILGPTVRVWEVRTPVPTYTLPSEVRGLTFSTDGKAVATSEMVSRIALPEAGVRLERPTFKPRSGQFSAYHSSGGRLWALPGGVPFGKRMESFIFEQLYPTAAEYTFTRPVEPLVLKQQVPEEKTTRIPPENWSPSSASGYAVSHDGSRLLIGWNCWVLEKPTDHYLLNMHLLELWDVRERKRLAVWDNWPQHSQAGDIQFRADDQVVAISENGNASLWNVATGKCIQPRFEFAETGEGGSAVHFHSLERMTFTHDGRRLFGVLGKRLLGMFDAGTAKAVRTWPAPESEVTLVCVSPDGSTAATVQKDRSIALWDLNAGRMLVQWESHESPITDVCFHPSGSALISGDADGALKIWDLSYFRRELARLGLDW